VEPDPRRWIAVLRRSHDELARDVASMGPTDLRLPSACEEWDVSQVLSHLGSGAEIGLSTLAANVAGEEPSTTGNQQVWDRWNALEPQARADDFSVWDERHVEALEAIDDDTLASLQYKLPFLPRRVDMATAVSFRLWEHAVHSWDVRVAFTSEATVARYAVDLLLDRAPAVGGFVGRASEWRGGPTVIAISVTDPAAQFWLQLDDAVLLGTEPQPADGQLELPGEALVRLVAGRLKAGRTPASVSIKGPVTLRELRSVFPGY
jgi:uncharacterized protein (TIGR03083 family)